MEVPVTAAATELVRCGSKVEARRKMISKKDTIPKRQRRGGVDEERLALSRSWQRENYVAVHTLQEAGREARKQI